MEKEITPKEYRENVKAQFESVRKWVDENYEELWRLSKEAKELSPKESFRVDTKFGIIQFIPSLMELPL